MKKAVGVFLKARRGEEVVVFLRPRQRNRRPVEDRLTKFDFESPAVFELERPALNEAREDFRFGRVHLVEPAVFDLGVPDELARVRDGLIQVLDSFRSLVRFHALRRFFGNIQDA